MQRSSLNNASAVGRNQYPSPDRNRLISPVFARGVAKSYGYLIFAAALALTGARGQEALRMSIASQAAEALHKKTGDLDYYNLALGPVNMRFQSAMGIEFTDNANYSQNNRQADIGFHPGMNLRAFWQATEKQQLFISTGIGYTTYINNRNLDHLDVTPDSAIAFQMFAGDFLFDFHERVSVVQDVSQTPSVSGTGSFGQLENTTGVGVTWDLNQLVLTLGYDHDIVESTSSSFSYIDHASELFTSRATFLLNPTTAAGLELGGGFTTYDNQSLSLSLNNSAHYSVGFFYRSQLSQYTGVNIGAGYIGYSFEPVRTNPAPPDVSSYYANLGITHRANRWLQQTLSLGHEVQLGISSDTLDRYYARYSAMLSFLRDFPLEARLFWERGKEINGTLETYEQYGGGLSVGYRITNKLNSGVAYDLYIKNSDLPLHNYVQNRLVFSFTYSF